MKLLCVSCSNVLHKKNESASTKVCRMVEEIAHEKGESLQSETIRLADYRFSNCIFCGQCAQEKLCTHDDDFNRFFQKVAESERVAFVAPFYSVIPSKLTMIMEKINQVYYTAWLSRPNEKFILSGKKAAVIAHGGNVIKDRPEVERTYRELLLKPLTYSLKSLGFDVVGVEGEGIKGAAFGVEGYAQSDGAIFPDMVHDWKAIRESILPLVSELMQ